MNLLKHKYNINTEFKYMSEVSNFGLLDRFKGLEKKDIARNTFSTLGSMVGGSIGKAGGKDGKQIGTILGTYIGAKSANDTAALVRAIKQNYKNPEFKNLNLKNKIINIKNQSKQNALNYDEETIKTALSSLQETDKKTIVKAIKEPVMEKLPNIIDYFKGFFKYKNTYIKHFNN